MNDWKIRLYANYVSSEQGASKQLAYKSSLSTKSYPYYLNLIKKFIPKDYSLKIADLGCGHGALLFCLKELGYKNLSGADLSAEQVNLAHKFGITEVCQKDLILFLDESSESYDVIFIMDVLEHLDMDELFSLLDRVYKKLNVDGILVIHVPNGAGLFGMRIRYGDLTHVTCFTTSSMRQLLSTCGFNKIRYSEDIPVIHGFKSCLRYFLWKILTIFPRVLLLAETGKMRHILSQNFLAVAKKSNS